MTQTHWKKRNSYAKDEGMVLLSIRELEEKLANADEPPASALEIMEATGGAFNPYLGALVKLWNIDSRDGSPPYVPAQEEIDEALRKKDLDLGAYGKGAACDEVLWQMRPFFWPISTAVINLGGNILTYGKKPWGQPFQIALRDPKGGPNDTLGMFTLRGTHFISTSGSYEKYFERDGKRYHHIFDPETGYPAEREPGLVSVTVINDNGAAGDALSTACFVLGYRESQEVLQTYGCDAIFIYENGEVRATGGVRDYFTLTSPSYHWYDGVGA
ncbi:MAG: FAD:protein FMN transferase [Oscillospiraceae bacterium]|nr:FAD:protein FMN transferase [Oscillospiraceae bacterium]